ncbi:MAG: conjugal transfer protein TraX [Lachnospiraceae bacterium]|nr:conjugal transfer protein TraX [Lachnospiraceae bacterium]
MSAKTKLLNTKFLSGSTLKIIACISMFIDHMTLIVWKHYLSYVATLDYDLIQHYQKLYRLGRNIGRAAFPIYCFLLVEGFKHTGNRLKYLARLLVMAVLSEHAFNLMVADSNLDLTHQNVFLTLSISLAVIMGIHKVSMIEWLSDMTRTASVMCITLAGGVAAYLLKTDYSYKGVIAVTALYLLSYDRVLICLGGAICFAWEKWAIPAFIPVFFYNGKRGLKAKYFFYLFYPLHIYLIYFVVNYLLP